MASAGFYYDPIEIDSDQVTCSYCSLSLQGWEKGDDPLKEHVSRKPKCCFMKFFPQGQTNNEIKENFQENHLIVENDEMELDKENSVIQPMHFNLETVTEEEKEMTVKEFLKSRQEKAKIYLENELQRMIDLVECVGQRVLK